jgi:3-oxoacyl-[acyl-carrier protein] reductase
MSSRAALVSGGATGVGRATALRLAKRGLNVALIFKSSAAAAKDVAGEVEALGVRCQLLQADVADDAQCRAAVAAAIAEFGRLDVLINAAGVTKLIPFADLEGATDEVWRSTMDVNVLGAFHLSRAFASTADGQQWRVIVNVSSVAARLVQGSSLPYACSKAALDALTVGLARTLGPKRIRVVGVAPGFIAGSWLRGLLGEGYEAAEAAYAAAAPLGRVCVPDDVAAVIEVLALDSTMVTGQTLAVDGGMLIQGFTPAATPAVALLPTLN